MIQKTILITANYFYHAVEAPCGGMVHLFNLLQPGETLPQNIDFSLQKPFSV